MKRSTRRHVARTAGLLYRRLPACQTWRLRKAFGRVADEPSAIQQTSGLRYAP